MGRPKKQLVPRDYAVATRLAAEGKSEASIAQELRVAPRTLRNIKKRDPRLADAIELGRAELQDRLIEKLVEMGFGGDRRAVVEALRLMFFGKEDPAATAAVQVNIQMPKALTPDEYAQAIEAEVVVSKGDDDG